MKEKLARIDVIQRSYYVIVAAQNEKGNLRKDREYECSDYVTAVNLCRTIRETEHKPVRIARVVVDYNEEV